MAIRSVKTLMRRALHPPGIRGRLAFAFGGTSVLLSVALALVVGSTAKAQLEQQIGRSLAELAFQMTDKLDRGIFERYRDIQIVASLPALRETHQSPATQREILDQLQRTYPHYAWIGLADAQGRIRASTQGLMEGEDVSQRAWHVEGLKAPFVGNVRRADMPAILQSRTEGPPMRFFDVATPVTDEQGRKAGVLGAHLSWNWAKDVKESLLHPLYDRRQVKILVVDPEGSLLLGPDGDNPLDVLPTSLGRGQSMGYQLQTLPEGESFLLGFATSRGYRSYPGLGWRVIVMQDAHEAFAPALELQRQILLWGFGLGGLVALWGLLLARHYARPIRMLSASADRLRHGEAVELPRFDIREFNQLAASLCKLVSTLHAKESELQAANGSLESRIVERTQQLRESEERFRLLAYRDALTGLPNRLMFQEQLRQSLGYAERNERMMAVLFMDLDRFKQVNDTLGHDAGDLLLKEVAQRMGSCIRGGDVLARLAGDEFTLILNDIENRDDVQMVAERLIEAVAQPMLLADEWVEVSLSIGISLFPTDGRDIAALLKKADVAMYLAKQERNAYQFFGQALDLANQQA